MFTTYLLYNMETDRLALEFEKFNDDYLELRRKFNKIMKKSKDATGDNWSFHVFAMLRYI